MPPGSREPDIVLSGATGFTGELIAAYLADRAPSAVRIALAGRAPIKLEAVRARIGSDHELVTVDATDPAALRRLTERTRVLVTTVGSYLVHGDPVVAACADTGTDYLDLTGEPEFVDLTYLRHHTRAVATGARLLHACGFDSVPHDLGVQFAIDQLPEDLPLSVQGYVRVRGTFSGGTAASALEVMSRRRQGRTVHDLRRQVEPEPEGRSVQVVTGRLGRDPDTGWWVTPMPTIDPLIVAESARQLPRYGPEFRLLPQLGRQQPCGPGRAPRGRRGPVRRGPVFHRASGPHATAAFGQRAHPGPTRRGLVLRPIRRPERRSPRGDGGGRRRPRLHEDVEDDR
jgi:saccharopine dehydrogenase (NAD+, L-glutamate forming)